MLKYLTSFLLSFCICYLQISLSEAHKNKQIRVVHAVMHDNTVELYINFLPPTSSKNLLWRRLFDTNKNRILDPKERLALGGYLAKRLFQNLNLQIRGQKYIFTMVEIQNSRLRGEPLKQRYSWDFRYQIKDLPIKAGLNTMLLSIPLLSVNETIPVAVVSVSEDLWTKTSSTSLLERKGRSYALCTMRSRRPFCHFAFYRNYPTSQQTSSQKSKPTTRNRKKQQ